MLDEKRERGRKTRHSLLLSSFSCCCRVIEALYVLKTFAVNPGMREVRCLFSTWVCEDKNKILKVVFTQKRREITIFYYPHSLQTPRWCCCLDCLEINIIHTHIHTKKMSKREDLNRASFFPPKRHQTFVPTLMDLWVQEYGLYVPDIKKTYPLNMMLHLQDECLKKDSQTNYMANKCVYAYIRLVRKLLNWKILFLKKYWK